MPALRDLPVTDSDSTVDSPSADLSSNPITASGMAHLRSVRDDEHVNALYDVISNLLPSPPWKNSDVSAAWRTVVWGGGAALLCSAAKRGDGEMVRALRELGVPVNAQVLSGAGAIHVAAENGNLGMLGLLTRENGAQVDLADRSGDTALMWVAARWKHEDGQSEMVDALLTANSDVHKRNCFGETSLLIAVGAGYVDVARRLIDFGASVGVVNDDGQGVLEIAREAGYGDGGPMISMLRAAGALPIGREDRHGQMIADGGMVQGGDLGVFGSLYRGMELGDDFPQSPSPLSQEGPRCRMPQGYAHSQTI